MSNEITRRESLKGAAAATTAAPVPPALNSGIAAGCTILWPIASETSLASLPAIENTGPWHIQIFRRRPAPLPAALAGQPEAT